MTGRRSRGLLAVKMVCPSGSFCCREPLHGSSGALSLLGLASLCLLCTGPSGGCRLSCCHCQGPPPSETSCLGSSVLLPRAATLLTSALMQWSIHEGPHPLRTKELEWKGHIPTFLPGILHLDPFNLSLHGVPTVGLPSSKISVPVCVSRYPLNPDYGCQVLPTP